MCYGNNASSNSSNTPSSACKNLDRSVLPNGAEPPPHRFSPGDADSLAFQNAVGFEDAVIADDFVYLPGVVAGPAQGEAEPAKLSFNVDFH